MYIATLSQMRKYCETYNRTICVILSNRNLSFSRVSLSRILIKENVACRTRDVMLP